MKKVLVIWLWGQWEKYINYFKKNNYEIFWVCKTINTKHLIENKFNISVSLNYSKLDLNSFNLIIVCLPPEIQWTIWLDILQKWYKDRLIIEIPVTWNNKELEEIKKYKNVFFFLEEYYTLMAQFLRKIDINKIKLLNINIITNKIDYANINARKVSYIHVNNNFIWTHIKLDDIVYNFEFHDREDIFYEIYLEYNKSIIIYVFNTEKYLKIWDKKIIDNYNFDNTLSKIIYEDNNFSKYYLI